MEVFKKLKKDILEEIENIVKNAPNEETDYFNNLTQEPIRRKQQEGIDKIYY